jgi:hypothetical protein
MAKMTALIGREADVRCGLPESNENTAGIQVG